MDEKAQKAIDKIKQTDVALAHSQAHRAIGEAAVRLHERGAEISRQSLVDALLDAARGAGQSVALLREKHEEAARLLGWQSGPAA